jgi:membrane protein DedA with SNARE-associated domain/rhodanese-related sulfurtransferase
VALFAVVLLEQVGAPIPALPVVLLAGARAFNDPIYGVYALAVCVLACTLGAFAWFWAGRRYGYRVLKLLCRASLSPDTCVRTTETSYARRGIATLVVAKFVPGLSLVVPPVAGALGLRTSTFIVFMAAGAALYSGAGLIGGLVFHDQIAWLIDRLLALGARAVIVVVALLALYVAFRWLDRWRFLRSLRTARISVDELYAMMSRGEGPLVLDVRSRELRERDGRKIPGARGVDLDDLEHTLAEIPRDRDVVVYCSCPNEATAAKVALLLHARGFRRVRPLAGGIDAWVAAGLEIEAAIQAPRSGVTGDAA